MDFCKTKSFIIISELHEIIDRKDFESFIYKLRMVDSWDEYYSDGPVEVDLLEYIKFRDIKT